MYIISKFKDYYDYLQGIYGVDNKLVLDRTDFNILPYIPSINKIQTFYICDYIIQGLWVEGKIYYGNEIEPFSYLSKEKNWYIKPEVLGYNNKYYRNITVLKIPELSLNSPNKKLNCPILLEENKESYLKNPILKDYNFVKVFSPEEIWIMLSTWLGRQISDNEKQVPIGDDKIRILSHGFDLKTSFRGK